MCSVANRIRRIVRCLVVSALSACLLFGTVIIASAQGQPSGTEKVQFPAATKIVERLAANSSEHDVLPYVHEVPCDAISDEPTRAICWEAYQASLQYYGIGLTLRSQVFAWQHFSTRIIFVIVLILVMTGIYFAWVQFKRDMGVGTKRGVSVDVSEHSVELSPSSIKVSSPVLGVIILALSLAFFYLYLVYVYPIENIF